MTRGPASLYLRSSSEYLGAFGQDIRVGNVLTLRSMLVRVCAKS